MIENEQLVATAMAGFDGHRGWLYYVAVDPEQQSRGIGRKIVQQASDWLRDHGAVKVQLMVRSENAKVVDFYTAQGFEDANVVVLGKRLVP